MQSRYSPVVQVERASTAIWYIIKKKSYLKIKTRSIIALTHNLKGGRHQYVNIVPVSALSEKILKMSRQRLYSPSDINEIRRCLNI